MLKLIAKLLKVLNIDEMAAQGIRPDTPRQKSGALPKYAARKKAVTEKGSKIPGLDIPNAKEVLAREKLATIELVGKFQEHLAADKIEWQQRLSELPDEAKLARYRDLGVKEYVLANAVLSDDEKLPVTLNRGLVDFAAQAVVKRRNIDAEVQTSLKAATITVPTQQGTAISQAIAGALSGITNVSASAKIMGTIDDYTIKISSDLDDILKKVVDKAIKKQTARFKQDLQDGVMTRTKGPLANASGSFTDFGGIAKELTARLQAGGNLLK